jgi:hypothetical protein
MLWCNSSPIPERILLAKSNFIGPCFFEIFACAAWNIWKVRNDLISEIKHQALQMESVLPFRYR